MIKINNLAKVINCYEVNDVECHRQWMLTKPSTKTFLQTGGDDLGDLDSPGWLPYTEICGNLILAWTTFPNLLPILYYGGG